MAMHSQHNNEDISNNASGLHGESIDSFFISDNSGSQELIRVRKKRKKHGNVRKVILAIVCTMAALCICGGIAFALYMNSISESMKLDTSQQDKLDSVLSDASTREPFYMLFSGSDAREEDESSRSDTIILARIDANVGKVTLVSIPRDTKVEIEGYGTQKINAAYSYGGPAGAVEAVENFAGVDISHYVEIHFDEFETVVDQLGGVWVDIPVSNNQTGSSNTGVELNAGMQRLNGEQALAFARERYGYNEGDFQRAENQRILVQALADEILSLPAVELPGTIQSLANCISTDFDLNELISLVQTFQSAEHYYFYSAMVPSTTQTIDGVSYTITLEDEWKEMMAMVDSGQDPSKENVLNKSSQSLE